MKKLLLVAIVWFCGFLNSAQAQLPGNPSNPHGTLLNYPGLAVANWERVGYNLYWEFTLTTPGTFTAYPASYRPPYVEFWASNGKTSPNIIFPGSMSLILDGFNYPYGTRYYSGIIDLSDYEEGWTFIQADFMFYTGDPNDPQEISETNFEEELGFP